LPDTAAFPTLCDEQNDTNDDESGPAKVADKSQFLRNCPECCHQQSQSKKQYRSKIPDSTIRGLDLRSASQAFMGELDKGLMTVPACQSEWQRCGAVRTKPPRASLAGADRIAVLVDEAAHVSSDA
jgi:hypothetical protein